MYLFMYGGTMAQEVQVLEYLGRTLDMAITFLPSPTFTQFG